MQMLQEVVVAQLQPSLAAALPDFQIVWSYKQQLKPTAINARQVVTTDTTIQTLEHMMASSTCSCHMFDTKYKVPIMDNCILQHCPQSYGTLHVRTTDMGIVRYAPLRHVLSQGLNHIPLTHTLATEVVAVNLSAAQQFFDYILVPTATSLGIELQHDAWAVISQSAEAWTMYQLQHANPAQTDELNPAVLQDLTRLQQHLHICEVDKAANTPCFICPQYAQLLVLLRLTESADFVQIDRPIHSIVDQMQADLCSIHPMLGTVVDGDRLPIMRIAYKSHKQSYRFLTNASNSLLSGLNSLAQGATSCIMEGLQGALGELNERIQAFVGVATQTCIVVANSQHVAINLPSRIHQDLCADITQCFENIPTSPLDADSLPAALTWAVDKAFSFKAKQRGREQVLGVKLSDGVPAYVRWQNQPTRGMDTHPNGNIVYLTADAVARLLSYVVSTAYVTAAGKVFKQAKGIPMGADYSPDACNLYFMKYECSAVVRMCRLASSVDARRMLCQEWLHCFRMMDDMRFCNAPTLAGFLRNPVGTGDRNALGWIYPSCVGIDITYDVVASASNQPQDTQYLDMLTHISPDGTYSIEIYDKQHKLPITPINYITLHSNRPVSNCYKLVVGQACRISAVCSNQQLAAKHLCITLKNMGKRGFSPAKLLATLRAWAAENDYIPGKSFTMTDVVNIAACRRPFWLK
jgi:hypothetical protein